MPTLSSLISIRSASLADAQLLSEVIAENARVLLREYYSDEQWHAFMSYYSVAVICDKIKTQQVFCAIQSDELVGTVALDKDYVVGFYTSVQHLRRGIGSYMMRHIEQVARQQEINKIYLAASPAALPFYYKNRWLKVRDILPQYAGVEFEETLMMKRL